MAGFFSSDEASYVVYRTTTKLVRSYAHYNLGAFISKVVESVGVGDGINGATPSR